MAILFAKNLEEAKRYCAVLEDERIPATVGPPEKSFGQGVPVFVPDPYGEHASEILASYNAAHEIENAWNDEDDAIEVDDDEDDVEPDEEDGLFPDDDDDDNDDDDDDDDDDDEVDEFDDDLDNDGELDASDL